MGIPFKKTLFAISIAIVEMAAMNVKTALIFLIGYSNQLNKLLALKISH